MSNPIQSIFIIRYRRTYYVHSDSINFGGLSLTTDIGLAHRFTMREANQWIHEQQWPSLCVIEYAPLSKEVLA